MAKAPLPYDAEQLKNAIAERFRQGAGREGRPHQVGSTGWGKPEYQCPANSAPAAAMQSGQLLCKHLRVLCTCSCHVNEQLLVTVMSVKAWI